MEVDAVSPVTSLPEPAWLVAFKKAWQWARRTIRNPRMRRLRLAETLSLGDRRFVAVIEFNGEEFLVGGSGSSFELLARLKKGKLTADTSHLWQSRLLGDD